MMRVLSMIVALMLASQVTLAVEPDEILPDPAQEARARSISKSLRCMVCQNESIDDSNARLARDLRIIVRQRITEGDTDEEVVAFVYDRYGDFVLLRPPVKSRTWLLWFGPLLILLGGAFVSLRVLRSRGADTRAPAALTQAERDRLAAWMHESAAVEGDEKDGEDG